MTYQPRRFLKFRRDLSIGDPDVDTIMSPNIPLLGITASLQNTSMITNLGITSVTTMLGTKSIVNITISQYLWGYEDRLVTLANRVIPSWINFEKFGILERVSTLEIKKNNSTFEIS